MSRVYTQEKELAEALSAYNLKERLRVLKAARNLRKFKKLTSRKQTKEEELDSAVEELEKE